VRVENVVGAKGHGSVLRPAFGLDDANRIFVAAPFASASNRIFYPHECDLAVPQGHICLDWYTNQIRDLRSTHRSSACTVEIAVN